MMAPVACWKLMSEMVLRAYKAYESHTCHRLTQALYYRQHCSPYQHSGPAVEMPVGQKKKNLHYVL